MSNGCNSFSTRLKKLDGSGLLCLFAYIHTSLLYRNLFIHIPEATPNFHGPHSVFIHIDTGFLTQREEHKLRVSENKVLRKIFGPKRKEMALEKTT
jgi:hypothetical protein